MKRILFTWGLLIMATPAFSQGGAIWADQNWIEANLRQPSSTDTLFQIQGTGNDTSEVFMSAPYITLSYLFTNTDSLNMNILFQTAPKINGVIKSARWVTTATLNITTTSTSWRDWVITATAISNKKYGRFVLDGQMGNSNKPASSCYCTFSRYYE